MGSRIRRKEFCRRNGNREFLDLQEIDEKNSDPEFRGRLRQDHHSGSISPTLQRLNVRTIGSSPAIAGRSLLLEQAAILDQIDKCWNLR